MKKRNSINVRWHTCSRSTKVWCPGEGIVEPHGPNVGSKLPICINQQGRSGRVIELLLISGFPPDFVITSDYPYS
jgi:hypothetical protein